MVDVEVDNVADKVADNLTWWLRCLMNTFLI